MTLKTARLPMFPVARTVNASHVPSLTCRTRVVNLPRLPAVTAFVTRLCALTTSVTRSPARKPEPRTVNGLVVGTLTCA